MRINHSTLTTLIILAISFTCLSMISCDAAGRSASQAFDNANSVIKTGSDKLFMETVTPTPAILLTPERY